MKTEKKKKGRRKLPEGEKKEQLNIYIRGRIVKNAGGKEEAEKFAAESLESNFNTKPPKAIKKK